MPAAYSLTWQRGGPVSRVVRASQSQGDCSSRGIPLGKITNFLPETPGTGFFFREETHAITARPSTPSLFSVCTKEACAKKCGRCDARGCGGESFSPLLFPVLSRVHSRLPLLKTCVNFALCYLCITVCCVTESVHPFFSHDIERRYEYFSFSPATRRFIFHHEGVACIPLC